jgi:poly-gamma-glutamate synthesis protein (capsule biosynthesis protein)
MAKILIAGDYCPFDLKNGSYNQDNKLVKSFEIKELIKDADFSIVNLECPVADNKCKKIEKIGPSLCCSSYDVEKIAELGFDGVTMSNNHIFDYGEEGLDLTIKTLDKIGLSRVGAGRNLEEASAILYKVIQGKKIAFINCCEREFSIATVSKGGAMPLDIVKLYYTINKAKNNSDYVILIIHGGIEQYQYPSPRMVDTYRLFVDFGANAIINHHQHCYCGYEVYKDAPIFYGLGNFFFRSIGKTTDQSWYYGYMVLLNIVDDIIDFEVIPYQQNVEPGVISPLEGEMKDNFQRVIWDLNSTIKDRNKLQELYNALLEKYPYNIVSPFSNRYLQACVRRGYIPSFIPRSVMRNLYNKITCISHRDRFVAYLEKIIYEIKA